MLFKINYKKIYITPVCIFWAIVSIVMLILVKEAKDALCKIVLCSIFGIYFISISLIIINMLFYCIKVYDNRVEIKKLFKSSVVYLDDITSVKLRVTRGLICTAYIENKKAFEFSVDMNKNGYRLAALLKSKGILSENLNLIKQ